jgi:hypothetical protein
MRPATNMQPVRITAPMIARAAAESGGRPRLSTAPEMRALTA